MLSKRCWLGHSKDIKKISNIQLSINHAHNPIQHANQQSKLGINQYTSWNILNIFKYFIQQQEYGTTRKQ